MNFDIFKERYNAKLDKLGASSEGRPSDDRLAEIYVGLVIFSEWNAQEIQKAQMDAQNKELERMKKEKAIYIPNKGIIQ